jgi:hypothetical protein
MWRRPFLGLLTAIALALAGLGAGASLGHAARTTAIPANHDYDHPAPFAQRAVSGAPRLTSSPATRSAGLQGDFASFRFFKQAGVAAEDSALVVRGGAEQALSPEGLAERIGTHPSGVTGWSTRARSALVSKSFCRYIPSNKVGVTTVGEIRAAGGDVIKTTGRSPNHHTITDISPEELNGLFGTPVRNPVPPELRMR